VHARAFQGRLGFDEPLNGSKRHILSLPRETLARLALFPKTVKHPRKSERSGAPG
jgi:hypothetical protein